MANADRVALQKLKYSFAVKSSVPGWVICGVAAFVIVAWPPEQARSLALKTVNWLADPTNTLPTLAGPLAPGLDDDADAVTAHDTEMAEYDRLFASSRTMRIRLTLKVAGDPFDPSTERQVLTAIGVLTALGVWLRGARRRPQS
jgi:hypothetical protein